MHVNKRVTRVQRVTESKLLAWYKENIPAPSPTLPSPPPPDDSNHTETLRFRVGMLHKIRHREFTNVLGFVLLICTRFIHAYRSKRREWTVFNKGKCKDFAFLAGFPYFLVVNRLTLQTCVIKYPSGFS